MLRLVAAVGLLGGSGLRKGEQIEPLLWAEHGHPSIAKQVAELVELAAAAAQPGADRNALVTVSQTQKLPRARYAAPCPLSLVSRGSAGFRAQPARPGRLADRLWVRAGLPVRASRERHHRRWWRARRRSGNRRACNAEDVRADGQGAIDVLGMPPPPGHWLPATS